jgi:hypothetical protein
MHQHVFIATRVFWIFGLTALASGYLNFAVAHEGHHIDCTETSINAVNTDIQAMDDGEAKTTAFKEMEMAEDLMIKKDMKACVTHMHNAMEAIEK